MNWQYDNLAALQYPILLGTNINAHYPILLCSDLTSEAM